MRYLRDKETTYLAGARSLASPAQLRFSSPLPTPSVKPSVNDDAGPTAAAVALLISSSGPPCPSHQGALPEKVSCCTGDDLGEMIGLEPLLVR